MKLIFTLSPGHIPANYPVEALFIGILIVLMAYYRIKQNKKLLCNEKLGITLSILHKTQTPLTLVQNLLNEIDSHELPEEAARKIKYALSHTRHIIDCNQNIIALNKLADKMQSDLKTNEFELYTYIDSIVNHCRSYAKTQGVKLKVSQTDTYSSCRINEAVLTAALQYLVCKIVDMVSPEGCISVTTSHTDNHWNLQITGSRNASPNYRQLISIWMPIRYNRSLRIVRQIIRLHGGSMTGSNHKKRMTIQITVPTAHSCKKEHCPITPYPAVDNYKIPFPCKEHLPPSGNQIPKSNKVPHILLVMADKELGGYMNKVLSVFFYTSILEDTEQVCPFPGQRNPDVIIIDEIINGVYGNELCSKIKSDTCMCNIPVILLISCNDNESYLNHIGCGADKIESRMINVCKLKADIMLLINRRVTQKERLKEFVATTLLTEKSESVESGDSDAILIDKIQKCLEKNLSTERYTVEMLCADIGMSRTSFYNRIKFVAGQSPTNYILSYKMGIAKTMLASGQYNVTEIATLLGYCNAKYFGKKFKEFYGTSPMQYVRDVMG